MLTRVWSTVLNKSRAKPINSSDEAPGRGSDGIVMCVNGSLGVNPCDEVSAMPSDWSSLRFTVLNPTDELLWLSADVIPRCSYRLTCSFRGLPPHEHFLVRCLRIA